jgi:hypothetical protein
MPEFKVWSVEVARADGVESGWREDGSWIEEPA